MGLLRNSVAYYKLRLCVLTYVVVCKELLPLCPRFRKLRRKIMQECSIGVSVFIFDLKSVFVHLVGIVRSRIHTYYALVVDFYI